MRYKALRYFIFAILLLIVLSSCAPLFVTNQVFSYQWMPLSAGTTIGQTFVAEYDGLNAIQLLVGIKSPGDGSKLVFHLRSEPTSTIDLTSTQIPLDQITNRQYYRFEFPPIKHSDGDYYFGFFELVGQGSVEIGYGAGDKYENGSAYKGLQPLDAQLKIAQGYDPLIAYIGIVKQLARWLLLSLIVIMLFTIPGWGLLSIAWKDWSQIEWLQKVPISFAFSLAILSLLVLYTYLIHIQLGPWSLWIPVLIGLILILYKNWKNISNLKVNKNRFDDVVDRKVRSQLYIYYGIFGFLFLLIFVTRFIAIRGLEFPLWNDSFHHTEITQLILDNQGLFNSWLPYTPYKTFSMHFGFSLFSAFIAWISGLSSSQAVLFSGQILNVIAIMALYPLAVKLSHGNRLGGIVAILAAGLLSVMPAYYINWGRYAQLAGQVILPIALWMTWDTAKSISESKEILNIRRLPWRKIIVTGVSIGGMLLFEFRMALIVAVFFIAWFIVIAIQYWKKNKIGLLNNLLVSVAIGLVSILVFSPWGIHTQQSSLVNFVSFNSNNGTLINLIIKDYQAWKSIRFYVPLGLLLFSIAGWIMSIMKKDWLVTAIGLWVIGMASLYAMILFHLPWVHYVQSFAVLITLYIPMALLCGYLSHYLDNITNRYKYGAHILVIPILLLGIFGAWNQRNIVHSDYYSLVTQPDLIAMDWIKENTPNNSRFLVEGIHVNWLTNITGADAGWWIPLLTKRENTMPPQYAIANEQPNDEDYTKELINLENRLEGTSVSSPDGLKLLCSAGITHIYIGQKQGMVGNTGKPLFTPSELDSSTAFRLLYHKDRVFIYSFEGNCE